MADHIDEANARAEVNRQIALANIPKPKAPSRVCLNCEEPLESTVNFCDRYCRDDYEKRSARHAATFRIDTD